MQQRVIRDRCPSCGRISRLSYLGIQEGYEGSQDLGLWNCLSCGSTVASSKLSPEAIQAPELTPREWDCLQFLADYAATNGWMPSVREICAGMEIRSTSGAKYLLRKLEDKQYIEVGHGKARAIRIVQKFDERSSGLVADRV